MSDSPWKNFTYAELACKCGHCDSQSGRHIDPALMDKVQQLRDRCGPLKVSSAYRCPNHPSERNKPRPGTHAKGLAIDIQCSGVQAFALLKTAIGMGFTGIGVSQKGDHGSRFIHLDISTTGNRPWLWSY
ncbi:YcbK family protein [Endozoicomonas euniceicola]|uniref:D-Ala-D-Ala carboxypeptidase family metallohydrolase n=1 Tax=Endozoicomonas euniceicola TaxID=1234143 RepID=A0ABY6GNG7_9GAMM|nr:D-Ala-D-Ala carboxypeptidase family metallohydrolase [Endozoicomonas euniceicola]UYM14271.1 D-Ala-D-Ala carboxypeptidase family metallohydrolase [Endozoicomonas euniceicola]